MNQFESLKKEVVYLSLSRKLVLFGSFLCVLFLFFPWGTRGHQVNDGYQFVPQNFHAFSVFPVFGWLLFLICASALFLVWKEVAEKKKNSYAISHSLIWIGLGAVGVYTIVVALFVFNSAHLKLADSHFSLKIGIFLTLFTQMMVVLGGHIGRKEDEKTYLRESLSRPQDVDTSQVDLAPEPPKDQMSLGDYDRK